MRIPVTSKLYLELRELRNEWLRAHPHEIAESWPRLPELQAEIERLAERVEQALLTVNGRATAFTITNWVEVVGFAHEAERRLELSGVTQKHRPGTKLFHASPGPSSKSYDASAIGTAVELSRGSDSGIWYMVACRRVQVRPKQAPVHYLSISEDAAYDVRRRAMEGFHILPGSLPSPNLAYKSMQDAADKMFPPEVDHDA